jgi:thioredoxin 1
MKPAYKLIIIAVLAIAVVSVFALKRNETKVEVVEVDTAAVPIETAPAPKEEVRLPRLIDLGAGKCIPCKMMEPILEELKHDYADQFTVTFYDVWKDQAPAQQYGIQRIPTQIFLDADGNELARHEGFLSRDDILAQWKAVGVDIQPPQE